MEYIKKYYIRDLNESCPSCHEGRLQEKFYLSYEGTEFSHNTRIGGPAIPVTFTLESTGATCTRPQCGIKVTRPSVSGTEHSKIHEELTKTVVLVKEDTNEVFPEILLDAFVPSSVAKEFEHRKELDLLKKTIEGPRSPLQLPSAQKTLQGDPDERGELGVLFDFLSTDEQIRLRSRFSTLQEEEVAYEKDVAQDVTMRLEVLKEKLGIPIPKGTQVEYVLSLGHNSFPYNIGEGPTDIEQQGQIYRLIICTGDANRRNFYLPLSTLVDQNNPEIMSLQKFWPENISFEYTPKHA